LRKTERERFKKQDEENKWKTRTKDLLQEVEVTRILRERGLTEQGFQLYKEKKIKEDEQVVRE
jgi:hypothetical protein